MTVHHYGLATKSIEKSIKSFIALGYEACSDIIFDPLQGVNLLFLKNENDHFIELVEPAATENPVSKILSKNGSSLYHICYTVDHLDQKIEELKSNRFKLVLPPTPAVAFEGRKICFLYHPSLGLIELLEK
ncbi:VOC family protein [Marnyiella aurantia]|uniref:VOC family protein n=1 Tax=Marnyiella aurantia TaxID=2758037 RepID=A0A7D7QUS3_9FLAO|nr:VOC family protein [Marnyiella aurantia]MBA5247430.1 VOC family protein [Marnyiella aurantia]QMS99187.1 VOC family protein [Marnyiella aurantia]